VAIGNFEGRAFDPGHSGELTEPRSANPSRPREVLLMPLAQNLTSDSVALHHALRLAVAASIALFITFQFELGHGYWLTMTTVLILQPYAATTWQLSLKRIIGSVFGGILAAALGIVFLSHPARHRACSLSDRCRDR
jgi:uncharacterized membrane protein YccC